jgi:hypothetical protein
VSIRSISGNSMALLAIERLRAQPHRTGLTVSSGAGTLAARLYHESIGLGSSALLGGTLLQLPLPPPAPFVCPLLDLAVGGNRESLATRA